MSLIRVPIQFEKYIAELRLKKIIPVITTIIEQGKNEELFLIENIEVISSILVRGILSHINTTYKYFNEPEILESMLLGIEELINNTLKTKNRILIR